MKTAILDFNRTLFDPDNNTLLSGAFESIKELKGRGFQLILVAKNEPDRAMTIEQFGLRSYFDEIYMVNQKTLDLFKELEKKHGFMPNECIIIGDRARSEIALGRKRGYIAIWLKHGKFQNELPPSLDLQPNFIATDWPSIMTIIHSIT